MLKDHIVQFPHCPCEGTEPMKREGTWTMRDGGRLVLSTL